MYDLKGVHHDSTGCRVYTLQQWMLVGGEGRRSLGVLVGLLIKIARYRTTRACSFII